MSVLLSMLLLLLDTTYGISFHSCQRSSEVNLRHAFHSMRRELKSLSPLLAVEATRLFRKSADKCYGSNGDFAHIVEAVLNYRKSGTNRDLCSIATALQSMARNTRKSRIDKQLKRSDGSLDGASETQVQSTTVGHNACSVPLPLDSFAAEMLAAHNHIRANVQPPASNMALLHYDDCLAAVALNYLRSCPGFNHNSQRTRSAQQRGCLNSVNVGENLYWSSWSKVNVSAVMKLWADEVQHYRYESNSCAGVCGHYTQIVWSSTTRVGCAQYPDCSGSGSGMLVICNYSPAGNWWGMKPYKSGGSCSSCGDKCQDNQCCEGSVKAYKKEPKTLIDQS